MIRALFHKVCKHKQMRSRHWLPANIPFSLHCCNWCSIFFCLAKKFAKQHYFVKRLYEIGSWWSSRVSLSEWLNRYASYIRLFWFLNASLLKFLPGKLFRKKIKFLTAFSILPYTFSLEFGFVVLRIFLQYLMAMRQ